jgi:hypothetical protein
VGVASGWTGCVALSRGSPGIAAVSEVTEEPMSAGCCVDLDAQPHRISNALSATPLSRILFVASIDFFPNIFFDFERCPIFIE